MKKLFVILIMALLGYESIGAEKAPILPRKSGNAEYSLQEVKTFVLNYGTVSDWFRTNLLVFLNRGLTATGENVNVDASNIEWIFQHITYEFKDLGPYTNSRLNGGVPEFFQDKDGWSGDVAVFRYGKCVILLYKTQCVNLLDIPVKVTTPPATVAPPASLPSKVDTVQVGNVTVVNNIYNTNTNTNTNTVCQPSSDVKYVMGEEEEYIQPMSRPVYYNQRPMMRQMPQVRMNFSIRGGRRQQNYNPPQQQQTPRGYMGGGRPAGGNQGYMGGGNPNGNNNGNQGGGRAN